MSSYCPQYEYLGDFHTHPYPNVHYQVITNQDLYGYSLPDYLTTICKANQMCSLSRIGLVIAVTTLERRGSKGTEYAKNKYNTIEFTLGNYRLWIKGYAAVKDEDNAINFDDAVVLLNCPSSFDPMLEIGGFCEFGRERKGKHITGEIPT